jgi:hypothetical protein
MPIWPLSDCGLTLCAEPPRFLPPSWPVPARQRGRFHDPFRRPPRRRPPPPLPTPRRPPPRPTRGRPPPQVPQARPQSLTTSPAQRCRCAVRRTETAAATRPGSIAAASCGTCSAGTASRCHGRSLISITRDDRSPETRSSLGTSCSSAPSRRARAEQYRRSARGTDERALLGYAVCRSAARPVNRRTIKSRSVYTGGCVNGFKGSILTPSGSFALSVSHGAM